MASKQQFIDELDEQVNDTRQSINEVGSAIRQNLQTTRDLKEKRDATLDLWVERTLPGLDPVSIERASMVAPGVINADLVKRMIEEHEATFRSKIDNLKQEFDPTTFDAKVMEAKAELKKLKDTLDEIVVGFLKIDTPSIARLVETGYETGRYPYNFLQFQYYTDWKEADEAVEHSGVAEWSDLAEKYSTMKTAIDQLNQAMRATTRTLAELERNNDRYDGLHSSLGRVPETVLEKLTTKLRGFIDSNTDLVPEVASIDKHIADFSEKNIDLQKLRDSMNMQLTNLQQLRSKVKASTRQQVPDDYYNNLKARRSGTVPMPTGVASVSHIHHHTTNNDGFFTGMMYGQMNSFFAQQAAYDRSHHDPMYSSDRRETRHHAHRDRSGQS